MRSGRAPPPAGGPKALLDAPARRANRIPGSKLRAAAALLVLATVAAAFLLYGGAGTSPTGEWIAAPFVPEWQQVPDAVPGYAFAQVQDSTPPTFVSSELDGTALTITFSETIAAANVDPAKIHVRESGNYTGGGITLSAGELSTTADGATISFTLSTAHQAAVAGLTVPELTIEPGAVRDTSGTLIVGTFDASTAAFADVTFPVSAEKSDPSAMAFSSDGTKMFVLDFADNDVKEYTLSSPFDVSTAAFANVTFSVSAQEGSPTGMAFSSNGTKMFVIGTEGNDVNEYTLSSPFDASTASFVDATSVSAQEGFPLGMAFSSNGTKMFVIGLASLGVNEYTLSSPFDASTASFVDATSVSAQENIPNDMAFSSDGSKMFVIGSSSNNVNEYTLSSPFDASTASFVDATSVSAQEETPTDMAFSSDGSKMFVLGYAVNGVNEYALSSVYPIAVVTDLTIQDPPPSFVSSILNNTSGALAITFSEDIAVTPATNVVPAKIHVRESGNYTGGGITLSAGELATTADGATISFALNASRLAAVAALGTPELTIEPGAVRDTSGTLIDGTFDASTAVHVRTTSVAFNSTTPKDVAFSNDGTRMFVLEDGHPTDAIYEYALSTPFDASTLSFVDETSVSNQEDSPTGMAFSNDGTRMFVIGGSGDDVNEYNLSPAFDASTRSFVDATSVSDQESAPNDVAFSNDGTRMFVIGGSGDDVNEYTLSTAFDASTRSFVDATSVSDQENSPQGIAFSNDGAKMFVVGATGQDVNEYTLSTAFDASTLSFVDATSVSDQENSPQGIAFSNDGAKMFVTGTINNGIYEYALSSVYPITVVSDPFLTTWETVSANQTIGIPVEAYSGETIIDWGDGNTTTVSTNGTQSHTYATADSYQVAMTGNLLRIDLGGSGSTPELLHSIDQWGDIKWSTMNDAFLGATEMTYNATDAPDLSQVTDMSSMFKSADTFNGDISTWNTSSVTSMLSMFESADTFNGDISTWNTSSVTDMTRMFTFATEFNGNISDWDTSSVRSMTRMFTFATEFNGNISAWDTSSVTKMISMFDSASKFNRDISAWDTSLVTDMSSMFYAASAFDGDISDWDTSSVTSMLSMFESADTFNGDISTWNTSSVTDMSYMFYDAAAFNGDISVWNVSSVMDMDDMFINAFDQNLGPWYIVLDDASIDLAGADTTVGAISPQNTWLARQGGAYGIGETHDHGFFEIDGTNLAVKAGAAYAGRTDYVVNITSTHPFGADNHRLVDVTVTDTSTAFKTTWNTTSTGESITIPVGGATGNYTVDWGDGSDSTTHVTDAEHTYATSGNHTVSISGNFTRIHLGDFTITDAYDNAGRLASIVQWGDMEWATMEGAFVNAYNMAYNATDAPDLSNVSSMRGMFEYASAFNGDLSGWNVSGVTDMNGMFEGASAFNGNVSGWNVSGVTDMASMFGSASAFNGNVSGWNVSGVTDMASMFWGASAFNGNVSGWNVSGVTDMASMFGSASAFNGNVSGWNVSRVTNMAGMFQSASAFNADISGWNVSSVDNMNRMFRSAASFNADISGWNVSRVTNMAGMFQSASAFNADISGWNVSSVDNMNRMFRSAASFNADISGWNVSRVTDMADMFRSASVFNADISGWNVSAVTNMGRMLDGASSFDQNLGNWHIVLDGDTISGATETLGIGAQNSWLSSRTGYGLGTGGNSDLFVVNATDKTLGLDPSDTHSDGTYLVNITSTGGLGTNNHRLYNVTVDGLDTTTSVPQGAFVTTWKADTSPDTVGIRMQVHSGGTVTIDWGDGNSTTVSSNGTQTHTYQNSGRYQVAMTGNLSRIMMSGSDSTPDQLLSIDRWGNGTWGSMQGAFKGATNMEYKATDTPDLSGVGNMFQMFRDTQFTGNLSGWNVSAVTNMKEMFYNAISFNGNLSGWDVLRVTNMHSMFYGAHNFNQTLSSWDTSGVTDMRFMFHGATFFDGNISSWDTSGVETMREMFHGAEAFNQDVSGWNVSGVTNMREMFHDAEAFNQDVSGWNVSRVTNMADMFNGADSFQQNLGEWYVVLNNTSINAADAPGTVGTISAQNSILAGQATYGIGTGGDSTSFNITGGSNLNMNISSPTEPHYTVNITSTGSFGTNNHRVYNVTVTSQDDTTTPAITITPDPVTVEQHTQYNHGGVSCADDGSPIALGSGLSFDAAPDTTVIGNYTITYTCSDGTNSATDTRTVQVRDTVAPVISLNSGGTTVVQGSAPGDYSDPGASCTDGPDTPTVTSDLDDEFDATTAGTPFTITYTCTDDGGNPATVTKDVSVTSAPDTTTPAITITPDPVTVEQHTQYNHGGVSCADDGSPIALGSGLSFDAAPDTTVIGNYTITYTCSDGTNSATDTRTVQVRDTVAPVISLNSGGTTVVQGSAPGDYSDPGASCTDGPDTPTVTSDLDDEFDATTAGTPFTITYTCTDDGGNPATVTKDVTVTAAPNRPPVAHAGADSQVSEGVTATLNGTGSYDPDDDLTYSWVQVSGPGVTLSGGNSSVATFVSPRIPDDALLEFELTVTDGFTSASDRVTITVLDDSNDPPVLDTIGNKEINELESLEFTATATDMDGNELAFSIQGDRPRGAATARDGAFSWTPDQSQNGRYVLNVTVSDGDGGEAFEAVNVTVRDVAPQHVSARASSSGITLTLSEAVTSSGAGPNGFSISTRGDPVSVESVTGNGTTSLTLSVNGTVPRGATLSYDSTLGDVADETGKPLASFTDLAVSFSSKSRSSAPPPPVITSSPDPSDADPEPGQPLQAVRADGAQAFPLVIDGWGYALHSSVSTLVPTIVTAGQPVTISVTLHDPTRIAYFAVYLDLQGNEISHLQSDAQVVWDRGGVRVIDPNGLMHNVTMTVLEDPSDPDTKTATLTVTFSEEMQDTNMVIRTWNSAGQITEVRLFGALTVTPPVDPEPGAGEVDPEPREVPVDPEPREVPVDPEPEPAPDTAGRDLLAIRMWSGFEPESITDAQLLASLNLDYPGADIPSWVMTELGPLVVKGGVTVGEFRTALEYVLGQPKWMELGRHG